jgi:hypothetical protein
MKTLLICLGIVLIAGIVLFFIFGSIAKALNEIEDWDDNKFA